MNWNKRIYKQSRHFTLPKQKVWELLSATDHLNRVIGLYSVHFEAAVKDNSGLFREAYAKVAGFLPMRWKEYPFQWQVEESYSVLRIYSRGPMKTFLGGLRLEEAAETLQEGSSETNVVLFSEVVPSSFLGCIVIPFVIPSMMRNTLKYIDDYINIQQRLQRSIDDRPQIKETFPTDIHKLDLLMDNLKNKPILPSLIPQLRDHLTKRGDDEVMEMRPYEIADRWGKTRDDVLRLFLYATHIGLLNLSWNVLCPHCRVSKSATETLFKLKDSVYCDFCGIDYEVNFDRYVELCFSVHPSLRKAVKSTYCVGGPALSPHIITQVYIEKGSSGQINLPRQQEHMRLRVLQENHIINLTNYGSAPQLIYRGEGWSESQYVDPSGEPYDLLLQIENQSMKDIVVVLEKTDWSDQTVTAAYVTAMKEFRGLFSSEVLAPGQQIGIESATLLFSDLKSSTRYYEKVGDPRAYGLVRRHFELLGACIHDHDGSIVKTIGDAVMAVFMRPEHALSAALDIQSKIKEFNRVSKDDDIIVKMGLHHGAVVAVNANNILDYFGKTVNLAARIQGTSQGDDVVLAEEIYEIDNVQDCIKHYEVKAERFEGELRGYDHGIKLIRLSRNEN